ncbi:MAG TPA: energy transducer TonB [Patescibacteria group bacterium]|nr:energy transducer TonB [Patescibacteria group bacterium]
MAVQQVLVGCKSGFVEHHGLRRVPPAAVVVLVALAHLALGLLALRQGGTDTPILLTPPQPVSVRWVAAPEPPQPAAPSPAFQPQPAAKPALAPPMRHPVVQRRPAVIAAAAPAASAATPAEAPAQAPTPAAAAPAGPERQAEPLVPPRADAAYLSNPPPAYPAAARRDHQEGQVMLRVLVAADGQPRQVVVERASGFTTLDDAAVAAVRAWRFTPGRRGETAIEAWVLIPISFTLRIR